MPKLTKALIASLPIPVKGTGVVWDSVTTGLGVRSSSGGARSFILKFRTQAGRQCLVTIARVGALTLDEVREEAAKIHGAVARGEDPAGARSENRRALLVRDLIALYEKDGLIVQRGVRQGEAMKPRTAAYTVARLKHHVVPLLGTRQAKDIGPGDIERFVRDVGAGKTAKNEAGDRPRSKIVVRGGDGAARKVVRDLSAVFSFAKRRGIVANNPCETASIRKTDGKRERYLSMEEITRLGDALSALEANGMNPKAADITRLWSLTGARRNEIAGLRWDEIDTKAGMLRLSASKTGKSARPLGQAALALIASLRDRRPKNANYVFPAERGKGFYTGTKSHWSDIVAKANLPGVTPHTLRHSLGSAAASGGEALLLVGSILGHSNARSTQIYAHISEEPAKLAADRASSSVARALSGGGREVV
jgi:integrase